MTNPPKVYSYLRFSSAQQLKGDSLRRQLERSRKWCRERGFELDESLSIQDLGISAYSGAHRDKGKLGAFVEAIKSGKIPNGSSLIVENLDRLTREEIIPAQRLFLEIIENGITIVTLMDGMEYSQKSVNANPTQLIISITVLMRGHEESKVKADRVSNAWAAKRKKANERPLTSVCPSWLKLNKKKQSFELVPDRVHLVNNMFDMFLAGDGVYKIACYLNKNSIPTFGKSKTWRISSIQAILKNRSVLGEYQPHRSVRTATKRKRIPDGPLLPNYYPRVVDPEKFHAAQTKFTQNTGKGGQKRLARNLFTHLCHCGECGTKLRFQNKGKQDFYFRCDQSIMGRSCISTAWRYSDFETAWLSQCSEFDIQSILSSTDETAKKIKAARLHMEAIQGELAEVDKAVGNIKKIMLRADDEAVIDMYMGEQVKALADKKSLEAKLSEAMAELSVAQSQTASTEKHLETVKELTVKLNSAEGDELAGLRQKLKNAIAQLVERIDVWPNGLRDRMLTGDHLAGPQFVDFDDEIRHLENVGDDPKIFAPGQYNSLVGELSSYTAQNTGKEARAFLIQFRAGGYRLVKQDGEGFANITATWDAMSTLTKSKKEVKLKEAINIKSGGVKS